MIAKIGELGLATDEIRLADASGLSRQNAISPSLLTDLLTLASSGRHPALAPMFGGLPVAGWSGTLRTRFASPRANEAVRVWSRQDGSLSGVNAISGTGHQGRPILVSPSGRRHGKLARRRAACRSAARLVAADAETRAWSARVLRVHGAFVDWAGPPPRARCRIRTRLSYDEAVRVVTDLRTLTDERRHVAEYNGLTPQWKSRGRVVDRKDWARQHRRAQTGDSPLVTGVLQAGRLGRRDRIPGHGVQGGHGDGVPVRRVLGQYGCSR